MAKDRDHTEGAWAQAGSVPCQTWAAPQQCRQMDGREANIGLLDDLRALWLSPRILMIFIFSKVLMWSGSHPISRYFFWVLFKAWLGTFPNATWTSYEFGDLSLRDADALFKSRTEQKEVIWSYPVQFLILIFYRDAVIWTQIHLWPTEGPGTAF